MKDPEDLAETHWNYVKGVIKIENSGTNHFSLDLDTYLDIIHHHYITSFIHGYKHGKESTNAKV